MQVRIDNEHSMFKAEIPGKCPNGHAHWRAVECKDGRDTNECSRCGKQVESACDFDDEFA